MLAEGGELEAGISADWVGYRRVRLSGKRVCGVVG